MKKKLDDRIAAKAWVSTVTETLVDKIQKRQWEAALEVSLYLFFFSLEKEVPFFKSQIGTKP